jgi:hypothetical protein
MPWDNAAMSRNKQPKPDPTDPITAADLKEWLDGNSDFVFERKVFSRLNELGNCGVKCTSGSTYDDPVTGKPRQYDIRASLVYQQSHLLLAIECKRLVPVNPLMVLRVPRKKNESYMDCLKCRFIYGEGMKYRNIAGRFRQDCCGYRTGDPIGKDTKQISRSKDNCLKQGDQEVYDKWAQAVHSAYTFITDAVCSGWSSKAEEGDPVTLRIIPVVIVPNGTLWAADFSDISPFKYRGPVQVDRCSYLIERKVPIPESSIKETYTMSHLEFMTIDGLESFCRQFAADDLFD